MQLLTAFAGLSMCCAALTALLPEGSLKKTALLAAGLLLTAMWLESMPDLARVFTPADAPSTWLTASPGVTVAERQRMLGEDFADEQAANLASP